MWRTLVAPASLPAIFFYIPTHQSAEGHRPSARMTLERSLAAVQNPALAKLDFHRQTCLKTRREPSGGTMNFSANFGIQAKNLSETCCGWLPIQGSWQPASRCTENGSRALTIDSIERLTGRELSRYQGRFHLFVVYQASRHAMALQGIATTLVIAIDREDSTWQRNLSQVCPERRYIHCEQLKRSGR
jgi:hypothetical protein